MAVTMKPKRTSASKQAKGTKVARKRPVRAARPKTVEAELAELNKWFEENAVRVYEAARANTRELTGRDEL